jgi:hypothetical protein
VSRTNASTVRVRPENVGLVPTRHRGLVPLTGDDGAGDRAVSQDGEPGGVDAIGRDRRIHRRRDVGGREAQHLAAPVATHHHPRRGADGPAPAGRHHVAGVHAGPDVGRRERDVLAGWCSLTSDMACTAKPNRSPALPSASTLPCGLLAEGEVLPTTTSTTCRCSTSSSWM